MLDKKRNKIIPFLASKDECFSPKSETRQLLALTTSIKHHAKKNVAIAIVHERKLYRLKRKK